MQIKQAVATHTHAHDTTRLLSCLAFSPSDPCLNHPGPKKTTIKKSLRPEQQQLVEPPDSVLFSGPRSFSLDRQDIERQNAIMLASLPLLAGTSKKSCSY